MSKKLISTVTWYDAVQKRIDSEALTEIFKVRTFISGKDLLAVNTTYGKVTELKDVLILVFCYLYTLCLLYNGDFIEEMLLPLQFFHQHNPFQSLSFLHKTYSGHYISNLSYLFLITFIS